MGRRDLVGPTGDRVTSVLSQPKRLCLLTYLATAPGPVSRAKLAALFWPESNETRARNALSQAVFFLRRSLGRRAVESVEGDQLRVPPGRVWCDARAFLAGELTSQEAIDGARRDVLEGWNADDSQPLQEWLDALRREVSAHGAELVERLGGTEGDRGHPGEEPEGASVHGASGAHGHDHARSSPTVEPSAAAVPATTTPRLARRWVAILAGTIALLLTLSFGLMGVRSETAVEPTEGAAPADRSWAAVVLLLPTLHGADPIPPTLHDAIRVRIAAELAGVEGLASSTSSARSATEARRELQAIGEPVEGKWFLTVLTTIDDHAAELTVMLGDGSRNYPSEFERLEFPDRQALVVEGPRRIARRVAATVEDRLLELERGRAGSQRHAPVQSPPGR